MSSSSSSGGGEKEESTGVSHAISSNQSDGSNYAHLFSFSGANKAGMENMDKEHQAKVIYEMSKNSAFFKRAQEQDVKTAEKVARMKEAVARLKQSDLDRVQATAANEILKLECQRNMSRVCVVFDMDMFYAAVEVRDRPELRNLPVAVGDTHMISTSNYIARKYGVRAAMPGFIGRKLCPNLVFVPPNFDKYRAVGEIVRGIAAEYDPKYRSFSLDEVYMDITAHCVQALKGADTVVGAAAPSDNGVNGDVLVSEYSVEELRGVAVLVVQELRSRIKAATGGLTCSAGIAHNFLCAKICADVNKPDGQFSLTVERGPFLDWFHALPVRKIPGIGKVMERLLHGLGVATVSDIHRQTAQLYHVFPGATGRFLMTCSLGIDSYERSFCKGAIGSGGENDTELGAGGFVPGGDKTEAQSHRKSISVSRTFSNITTAPAAAIKLNELCGKLATDMQSADGGAGLAGKCVTVNIKNSKFQCFSKCHSVPGCGYVQTQAEIFDEAWPLLSSMLPASLRLIGVSVSKFKSDVRLGQDRVVGTPALDKFFAKAPPGSTSPATVISSALPAGSSSSSSSSKSGDGSGTSGVIGVVSSEPVDGFEEHGEHTDTGAFDMQIISQGSGCGDDSDAEDFEGQEAVSAALLAAPESPESQQQSSKRKYSAMEGGDLDSPSGLKTAVAVTAYVSPAGPQPVCLESVPAGAVVVAPADVTVSCPVCNKVLPTSSYSNAAVNLHIDMCLSNSTKLLPNYFRRNA